MKFSQRDEIYKAKRKTLSSEYGDRELWSIIDQWPLYCGIGNLARFLAIYDILRTTLTVPGHVAEFGSWRGANLLFLAKLLRILDPHGSKVTHCFESFEGLVNFSQKDGQTPPSTNGPQYKGSLSELKDMISLYEMHDEIEIHQGFVEETLPVLLQKNEALSFSFVYCDVDLYSPTLTILQHIHSRLMKNGVFVFDEWNYENYPGETTACREFLETHGGMYNVENVQHASQPSLVLRKISMG